MNLKPENRLEPQQGRLLISDPFMGDPYFKRTVILLCDHNEEGSFGFILNRFLDIEPSEMMKEIPALNVRLGFGGPVENKNIYYLHTLGDKLPGSIEILNGLFLGGDFKLVKSLLSSGQVGENQIRFLIGYAGWGENQLNEEIGQGSWYVSEVEDLPIMDTHRDDLWALSLIQMGEPFAKMANFPNDPSLN